MFIERCSLSAAVPSKLLTACLSSALNATIPASIRKEGLAVAGGTGAGFFSKRNNFLRYDIGI